eukprot:GFKZ01009628.1.p1 GENE.GFKZ01009628.1~~GFKZ01009628.1.p1  ORF type:complete len:511 (+),score=43.36 GFKZ01009628.1:227-1759(+)
MRSLLLLITVMSLLVLSQSQPSSPPASAPTLLETLSFSVNPPNAALIALFPISAIRLQTPLAIRYVLLTLVGPYEIAAACNPVALSFFGTKDSVPPEFCDPLGQAIISSYITFRLVVSEFTDEGTGYGQFLQMAGLTPLNTSRDETTLVGWANSKADRAIEFFRQDGWNSQGDVTRSNFRLQFDDSTGYQPVNLGALKETQIEFPLRWQPLRFQVDFRGLFATQEHVTPHLGRVVMPLVMSEEEFQGKQVDGPYEQPNRRGSFSMRDRIRVERLVERLLNKTKNVTVSQITLAYWWENKFLSLGVFAGFYAQVLGMDPVDLTRVVLSEVMAQHDAVLLAWKEKRRHDLVRPTTIIRRLFGGKMIPAFKGLEEGSGMVLGDEWEPLVPVQPHSEFPSASAVICRASMDHLRLQLKDLFGNISIPAFEAVVQPLGLPQPRSPVEFPVKVRFRTLQEAARSCGRSRLLAGVHFAPSVPAGLRLAEGVGEAAFRHTNDLWHGRVPENCARCIST